MPVTEAKATINPPCDLFLAFDLRVLLRLVLQLQPFARLVNTSSRRSRIDGWRGANDKTSAQQRPRSGHSVILQHLSKWSRSVNSPRAARTTWCVCGCRSPWASEVQYTGLNEAATKENDNGILCWIGRVRQRNVDLYYG